MDSCTHDGTQFTNIFSGQLRAHNPKTWGNILFTILILFFIFMTLKHRIILAALLRRCPFIALCHKVVFWINSLLKSTWISSLKSWPCHLCKIRICLVIKVFGLSKLLYGRAICRCARCFLHLVSSLSYILRDKNTNTKRKEKVKVMNPICCVDQPMAAYNFHLSLAKAITNYLDTFSIFGRLAICWQSFYCRRTRITLS